MNHIDIRNRHDQLRLEYFSSLEPALKADRYTLSSHLHNEDVLRKRKINLCTLNCDCACTGQK